MVRIASSTLVSPLASWIAALDTPVFDAIAAISRLLTGEAIENFVEGLHDSLSKDVKGRARVGARHERLLTLEGTDRTRISELNAEIAVLSRDLAQTYGRLPSVSHPFFLPFLSLTTDTFSVPSPYHSSPKLDLDFRPAV